MGLGPMMGEDLSDVFEEDMELPGPMPINTGTRDEIEREHSAVDEVEYLFVSRGTSPDIGRGDWRSALTCRMSNGYLVYS